MGEPSLNDFSLDLEYSLEERENEMFDNFYYRAFPNLLSIEIVADLQMQREGIDKKLIFENSKTVLIDEKKRRKDYGDILLEEYSDFDNKKVGWLGRSKHTDYIVYAIMPSKKVYLLPFLLLQKAWIRNWRTWKQRYPRKFSINKEYRTSNIPVPAATLLYAITQEMKQELEAA